MKNLCGQVQSDVIFGELPRLNGVRVNGELLDFSALDLADPIPRLHAQVQYYEGIGSWYMAEIFRAEIVRLSGREGA